MQKLILDPNISNQEILYIICYNAILDGVPWTEDCFNLIKDLPNMSTEDIDFVFQQMNNSMIEQSGPHWISLYNEEVSMPTSYHNR